VSTSIPPNAGDGVLSDLPIGTPEEVKAAYLAHIRACIGKTADALQRALDALANEAGPQWESANDQLQLAERYALDGVGYCDAAFWETESTGDFPAHVDSGLLFPQQEAGPYERGA